VPLAASSKLAEIQEPPAPVPIRPTASPPVELPQTDGPGRRSRGDAPAPPAAPGRAPVSRSTPSQVSADADDDLADVSWNVFWPWARGLGYRKREEVEAFIGRPIGDLTPGEVRAMIVERRGET
jgi:hypothetical protein